MSSSDEEYVIKREIYDSTYLANSFRGVPLQILDLAAGIPGIILAILNPNKKVTLIDRKTTFIDFLEIVKSELKLKMSSSKSKIFLIINILLIQSARYLKILVTKK